MSIEELLDDLVMSPRWATIVNVHTRQKSTIWGIEGDNVLVDIGWDEFCWWYSGVRFYERTFIVQNFAPA